MTIDEAFWRTCADAVLPRKAYVSLYKSIRWYGGPEEGGWWGTTTTLEGYVLCHTMEEAWARARAVVSFAEEMTREAREAYGRMCLEQCEAAWARGMDPDDMYGSEPDAPEEYSVEVEEELGSHVYSSDRYYS